MVPLRIEPARGKVRKDDRAPGGYELSITLFMQYLTDPRYGWPVECSNRFGRVPQQVFHDGNSIVHVADFEG